MTIHIGNHKAALEYLRSSLTISREIGDINGEGDTLLLHPHFIYSTVIGDIPGARTSYA